MPTLEISLSDLSTLVGKDISAEELDELILFAKGELEGVDGDLIKVDMKDTNRPDLWSTEGIARQIRGILGIETGLPEIALKDSGYEVYADSALKGIRPYCVNAVVTGLDIDEAFLSQIIQLQEKVALSFGRKRKEVAVGIIDFDKITPPIFYKATDPDDNAFVPLTFDTEMTPREILASHPKGIEYGHLISENEKYPLLVDSAGVVLTMPPIINSEHTGKVTTATKNVFIDVTGYNMESLKTALNVLVSAFSMRGGTIHKVTVHYGETDIVVPDMAPCSFELDLSYSNEILGLGISKEEQVALLEKMQYAASVKDNVLKVTYLPYRNDIMHAHDVIEDIAIAYGYNDIDPLIPTLYTTGRLLPLSRSLRIVKELAIGQGFQEMLSFTLSNNEALFLKMGVHRPEGVVEIENPVSQSWSVMRNWLLPSMLSFLSKNTHRDYPQDIFEISEVVSVNKNEETMVDCQYNLCMLQCRTGASYTTIRQSLDTVLANMGIDFKIEPIDHPSFMDGRVGRIVVGNKDVGIVGELHPQVLENWGMETPISAAEIYLESILKMMQ